jgi:hypothetical protein
MALVMKLTDPSSESCGTKCTRRLRGGILLRGKKSFSYSIPHLLIDSLAVSAVLYRAYATSFSTNDLLVDAFNILSSFRTCTTKRRCILGLLQEKAPGTAAVLRLPSHTGHSILRMFVSGNMLKVGRFSDCYTQLKVR